MDVQHNLLEDITVVDTAETIRDINGALEIRSNRGDRSPPQVSPRVAGGRLARGRNLPVLVQNYRTATETMRFFALRQQYKSLIEVSGQSFNGPAPSEDLRSLSSDMWVRFPPGTSVASARTAEGLARRGPKRYEQQVTYSSIRYPQDAQGSASPSTRL
jgi:hypothetical protein